MRRNRNFRGRGRRRVAQRPKTVEQRVGLKQSGIITNGNRRYPGPITIPLRQVITIQLSNSSALASNSGGTIAGVIPCDPTATLTAPFTAAVMFPQYADWNLVLGQVRCVQLDVTVTPAQANETKGDINATLSIAGNIQNTTTPSAYTDTMNNSDSQLYPILLDDRGLGRYHSIRHGKDLGWASSVSPIPTPSLYQGCPGGIGFYGTGFPVSTTIGAIRITGTYQMRMWT